jgi:outer membrane protein insertion porin family
MMSVGLAALIVFTSAPATSLPASAAQLSEGRQQVEQVFIRGNRRIPESEVRSSISTHAGTDYDPKRLDRDVQSLFETGHFDDVRVFAEGGTRGGKIVTFEVRDKPLVSVIRFKGVDSGQQSEIIDEWSRQGLELATGSEYDPVMVRRACRIIRELLNSEENMHLRVTASAQEQSGEIAITFKVRGRDE